MNEDELRAAAARIDAAVERLTELAADTSRGPWRVNENGYVVVPEGFTVCVVSAPDASWIAAMSPAVLPPILAWLRDAAECIREHLDDAVAGVGLCANELQAIEFADVVMGTEM